MFFFESIYMSHGLLAGTRKTFTYTNVLNAITRMDIQVYCDLFGFYTLQYEKKV